MNIRELISFVKRIVLFSVFSVLILYGSNWVLSKFFFPYCYEKDNDFAWVSKTRNRVVLIGSSTVKAGLNANLISMGLFDDTLSVVNMGNMPTNSLKQYYEIEKNLDHFPDSCIFIIGIDPWVFSEKYYKYEPVMLPLWSLKQSLFMLFKEQFVWGCIGAQTDQLIMLKIRKPVINDQVPYNMGSVVFEAPDVNASTKFDEWVSYPDFGISSLYFGYFTKTISLINRKHARVILYYPPRRSDYLAGFNSLSYMVQFNKLIEQVVKENKLSIIDLGTILSDADNYWKDPVHLSKEGIDTVSSLFTEEVRKIILVRH
jgi:hypothetical protein